jgi:hypothetical protein
MIELKITGDADQVRAELSRLLFTNTASFAAPAVSDTSSDNTTADTAAPRQGRIMQPTVDTGGAVEMTEAEVVIPAKRTRRTKDKALNAAAEAVAATAPTPLVSALVEPAVVAEPVSDFAKINVSQAQVVEAEQDAADEAAETETTEDAPLTLDDVRNSALPYITKWGKKAAAKDLVPIVMAAGGVPNIGKLDPADQELLKKVMQAFADAAKAETRFAVAS